MYGCYENWSVQGHEQSSGVEEIDDIVDLHHGIRSPHLQLFICDTDIWSFVSIYVISTGNSL